VLVVYVVEDRVLVVLAMSFMLLAELVLAAELVRAENGVVLM
jgi:hypothetical protein